MDVSKPCPKCQQFGLVETIEVKCRNCGLLDRLHSMSVDKNDKRVA